MEKLLFWGFVVVVVVVAPRALAGLLWTCPQIPSWFSFLRLPALAIRVWHLSALPCARGDREIRNFFRFVSCFELRQGVCFVIFF